MLTLPKELTEAITATIDAHLQKRTDHRASDAPDATAKQHGHIIKMDVEKHLVYAEVYLPDVEDAHGHYMDKEGIEKMAHGFMKAANTTQIDVQHDNNTDYGCYLVESFIARKGDPDYADGAWVGVVKIENPKIWKMIKDGDLTGFSFEGMGYLVESDDKL